jgi:hypothetical protein
MAKSAQTNQRPRKALGEAAPTILNKKRVAEDTKDQAPVKKAKKTTTKATATKATTTTATTKATKQSVATPDFVYEVNLAGEEDVDASISNTKCRELYLFTMIAIPFAGRFVRCSRRE